MLLALMSHVVWPCATFVLQIWVRMLSTRPVPHVKDGAISDYARKDLRGTLGHPPPAASPHKKLAPVGRDKPAPAAGHVPSDQETLEALVQDALAPDMEDEAAAMKLVLQYEAQPQEHAYVALCSIFKNEHGNIKEWIEYHR